MEINDCKDRENEDLEIVDKEEDVFIEQDDIVVDVENQVNKQI